jgi:hypothetical protein
VGPNEGGPHVEQPCSGVGRGSRGPAPNGHAAEGAARCVDTSAPKHAAEAHHGKWIELTSEQWQFLRGIYAMNPLTPPGLPYGDKAALVKVDGNSGGMVFFIDGDKACTPMAVPDQLLAMMHEVATAKINHEGTGL